MRLGGFVWGIGYTLLGYFADSTYAQLETQTGRGLAAAVLFEWHYVRALSRNVQT